MSDVSPYALFEVEPTYLVDWDVLEAKKSLLQKTFHPDLFPAGSSECELATAKMIDINNAYKILKDPILRARALLGHKRLSIPGENGATTNNPKLMEEALSLKESLEMASINNDFDNLFEMLTKQQKICEDSFNVAFLENDVHLMNEAYIRLSFCVKTLADAKALYFSNMGN